MYEESAEESHESSAPRIGCFSFPKLMKPATIHYSTMSRPDLPSIDDGADADSDGEDDERHPLEVGLNAAEERDTAGIEDILEDIE